jgi:hypothetical protein
MTQALQLVHLGVISVNSALETALSLGAKHLEADADEADVDQA